MTDADTNSTNSHLLLVGIDPGSTTGIATADHAGNLLLVESDTILGAMAYIHQRRTIGLTVHLVIEDARLRKWFGTKGREVLQGVGSVKRDCSIWAEFCEQYACPVTWVKPQKGGTKWTAAQFARVTGWEGKTNEHSRDAALLIYKRKFPRAP